MPEAAPLALLRTDIDRHPHNIKRVLMEPRVRKEILGGISNDEGKAVKAFVSQNSENALKTKPKVSIVFPTLDPRSSSLSSTIAWLRARVVLIARSGIWSTNIM